MQNRGKDTLQIKVAWFNATLGVLAKFGEFIETQFQLVQTQTVAIDEYEALLHESYDNTQHLQSLESQWGQWHTMKEELQTT